MQRRATMSSTRSKHWCQLHTLLTVLHMPAAFKTWRKHVTAYFSYMCVVLEHAHVCAVGTTALTWQSMLWLSFAFLTILHTSAALVISHTYAVAQGDRIYRVLKRAQVCMTNINPSSLFQSQTMGGCRVCRMLAVFFF
jgi:hypothetical protein